MTPTVGILSSCLLYTSVGKYVIDGTIQNGSVVGGVVTWGYLLPFFLSNLCLLYTSLETPNDLSGYQEEIALLRSLEQTSK